MTPLQQDLWTRLSTLPLGPADVALSFTRRLARENGWSLGRAERVAREYRRFLLLAATAGHSVTPSDEVDQAWHLHLAYTESYWNDLCGGILGRPLHHGPTRGGRDEDVKFRDWYARTLESYRVAFGHDAPRDVWPDADRRFRSAAAVHRVDTSAYWMIPKRRGRQAALGLASLGAASSVLAHETKGAPVALVAVLVIAVVVVGIGIAVIARIASRSAGGSRTADGASGAGTFVSCGSSDGHSDGPADDGGSGCGSTGCGSGGCGGGGCGSS